MGEDFLEQTKYDIANQIWNVARYDKLKREMLLEELDRFYKNLKIEGDDENEQKDIQNRNRNRSRNHNSR